ncbi:hypothetical protein T05_16495 [Trichinella murrelli]|uniref:Uncharacterized protein n=1 Tax=Trichinella murrelli TaxID=144512 RepID=A0A0V0T623_9BILA|nr:hypothetical protein T05_16495 [Trichinella murrelli]
MVNCPGSGASGPGREGLGRKVPRNPFDCVQPAQRWHAQTTASSGIRNEVSGRLHGKQRLISIKSAVVLCSRLLDAVAFGNR